MRIVSLEVSWFTSVSFQVSLGWDAALGNPYVVYSSPSSLTPERNPNKLELVSGASEMFFSGGVMVCDPPIPGSVSFHLTDPMSCGGVIARGSPTLEGASVPREACLQPSVNLSWLAFSVYKGKKGAAWRISWSLQLGFLSLESWMLIGSSAV